MITRIFKISVFSQGGHSLLVLLDFNHITVRGFTVIFSVGSYLFPGQFPRLPALVKVELSRTERETPRTGQCWKIIFHPWVHLYEIFKDLTAVILRLLKYLPKIGQFTSIGHDMSTQMLLM